MTFDEKKKRALTLMEEKKMWRCNYAPPILLLLWKLGLQIPPAPFAPFWLNMLCFGSLFGFGWGIVMWFSIWGAAGYSISMVLQMSFTAGLLFGFFMALYHYWRRWINKLPDWNSLH